MSERTDQEFLGDIREAIRRGMAYVAGMTYEAFIFDTKTQDAVIRALEVLGEATKNLSEELRAHPGIPWKCRIGTRDVLIPPLFWHQPGCCLANCHYRVTSSGFSTRNDGK
jgi:uncharacterized protein with HEPN domain